MFILKNNFFPIKIVESLFLKINNVQKDCIYYTLKYLFVCSNQKLNL